MLVAVVCLSLIAVNSCSNTSDDVSETQIPAATTATTGPALNPTTTTGSETPSFTSDDVSERQGPADTTATTESAPDPTVTTGLEPASSAGGGARGSIVEVDVFESLLAIPPAADVCRQENLPVDAILPVAIVQVSCEFIPDDRITPFSIDVDYPLMQGPHAASINGEVRATIKDLLTKFLDSALHNSAYLVEVGLPYEAPFRLTGGVTLVNERLYSVELPLWYYVPTAAHGDNAVRNFTFDLETGERVLLADLFLPDSDWTTTLEASLEVALRESKTAGTIQHLCTLGSGPWEYEDSVYADTFNVTEDALRIYHWLAPYACRVEPFDIPYADLVDVLDPDGPLQPCEMSQGDALIAACGIGDVLFDVANASFEVRCGLPSSTPSRWVTFSDGKAEPPMGAGYLRVAEEAIVELVEFSPGPEVVAQLSCSGGGSGSWSDIHVFAGNTTEAKRLGQIVDDRNFDWAEPGIFGTWARGWQEYDQNCCMTKYQELTHEWDGYVDGWKESVTGVFVLEGVEWVRETPPEVFDVENATFDVEVRGDGCYGPMTFTDGEWIAPGSDDYFISEKAWVTEFAVVELVEESPGPEVVADLVCTPGGTMRTRAVVVFAGNSSEARQLGRTLKGSVEWVAEEFGSSVVVRYAPWLRPDPHCCPSQYELDWYEWQDGDWVETDFEVWRKDPDAERLGSS